MFRFEDLEIWKKAIEIAEKLFDIADQLEAKRLFKFAEQLRAAALSMPNNIAEGSGSGSDKELQSRKQQHHRLQKHKKSVLSAF